MKRLLLPLLAAIALPTAVNAESYWMIIMLATSKGNSLEKVEMTSIVQCEEQAEKIKKDFKERGLYQSFDFSCIKGK